MKIETYFFLQRHYVLFSFYAIEILYIILKQLFYMMTQLGIRFLGFFVKSDFIVNYQFIDHFVFFNC